MKLIVYHNDFRYVQKTSDRVVNSLIMCNYFCKLLLTFCISKISYSQIQADLHPTILDSSKISYYRNTFNGKEIRNKLVTKGGTPYDRYLDYYQLNNEYYIIHSRILKSGYLFHNSYSLAEFINEIEINYPIGDYVNEFTNLEDLRLSAFEKLQTELYIQINPDKLVDKAFLDKLSTAINNYRKEKGLNQLYLQLFVFIGEYAIELNPERKWTVVLDPNFCRHIVALIDKKGLFVYPNMILNQLLTLEKIDLRVLLDIYFSN